MFFICQVFAKKIFIFTKTARAEKFIGKRPLYLLRFCFDFRGFHSRLCDSFYNRFVFGPIGIVKSAYDKIGIKLTEEVFNTLNASSVPDDDYKVVL